MHTHTRQKRVIAGAVGVVGFPQNLSSQAAARVWRTGYLTLAENRDCFGQLVGERFSLSYEDRGNDHQYSEWGETRRYSSRETGTVIVGDESKQHLGIGNCDPAANSVARQLHR